MSGSLAAPPNIVGRAPLYTVGPHIFIATATTVVTPLRMLKRPCFENKCTGGLGYNQFKQKFV